MRWPDAPKVAAEPCGQMAEYFWAGEYSAVCILAAGHIGAHSDGITFSRSSEEGQQP